MESMRLSPQLVGFSVANDGGMRVRLCGKKKLKNPEPLSLFQSTAAVAPSQVEERSRRLFGVKVFDCVSLRTVNHMQGRRSQSGGLCAREHATHSPDTGHIEVQARTTHTHTFTHAYRHTHMPHAFTHTEQIKRVDCTAQCRRDAATSGFKICLSFLVTNAKGFFSLFFFFRLNEGFRKLNKCLFRACLWLRNCANTLQCAFLFCGTKKTR